MRTSDEDAFALAAAIREVKEQIGLCETCFNLAEGPVCEVCSDPRRSREMICVVEEPQDVIPIERTGEYRGLYHVLGGALSPIDGIDPSDLKIEELVARVDAGGVEEIVIATNPTTTGEATVNLLHNLLASPSATPDGVHRIAVSRLEPPSALLALRLAFPAAEVSHDTVPEPDPRLPLRPVGTAVWAWRGTDARPAWRAKGASFPGWSRSTCSSPWASREKCRASRIAR